jgi:hypothetical protein
MSRMNGMKPASREMEAAAKDGEGFLHSFLLDREAGPGLQGLGQGTGAAKGRCFVTPLHYSFSCNVLSVCVP